MTTPRIAIVSLIISLLLLGGYYFKGCEPTQEKIRQAEKTLEERKVEFEKQNSIVKDLPKFREELRIVENRFEEAKSQLPNTSQIPDLLKDIVKKAKDSGLTITTFQLMPERNEGFYASVPVKMAIIGEYHTIAIFFDEISKLSRIINISDLQMLEQGSRDAGGLLLAAQCTATTFKFVEQGAVPAPAKKKKPKKEEKEEDEKM
jgi:type IV pilus assembly protein PilO